MASFAPSFDGAAGGEGAAGGNEDADFAPPAQPIPMPVSRDCAGCGAKEGTIAGVPNHRSCAKCHMVFYCGRSCQVKDWKNGHKEACFTEEQLKEALGSAALAAFAGACFAACPHRKGQSSACLSCEAAKAQGSTTKCSGDSCATKSAADDTYKTKNDASTTDAALCEDCEPEIYATKSSTEAVEICDISEGSSGGGAAEESVAEFGTCWSAMCIGQSASLFDEYPSVMNDDADKGAVKPMVDQLTSLVLKSPRSILSAFHSYAMYMKELREKSVQQACPKCQRMLPPTPKEMYQDSANIFHTIKKKMEKHKDGPWNALDPYTQQVVDDVLQLWEEAAEQGDEDAQSSLGTVYVCGQGVKKDFPKAGKWYGLAAEQENSMAQFNLGQMYSNGDGVEQNYKKAVYWYKKSAAHLNTKAQFNLGKIYEQGRGLDQNNKKAFEWYEKAAEQGDAGAQCSLGVMYYHGTGVQQSEEKAMQWYTKAAAQGNAHALKNIGTMYHKKLDYVKAKEWYSKSAKCGNQEAQEKLRFLETEQKAELGDLDAQKVLADSYCSVGDMYKYGTYGKDQNYKKAVELYKKAVKYGHAKAQHNMGEMHYYGWGVQQSFEKAFIWWEKSAEQGNMPSMYHIACMYEDGEGVERDNEKAKKWWKMSGIPRTPHPVRG
jgi:TPR repeat protein